MAGSVGPNIIEEGLVFYVDAANKESYPGSGTTWVDLSGNGGSLDLINGPLFDSGNGGSFDFDGTNDFARETSWNGPSMTINGPLTISNWVNYDSYGSTRSTLGLTNGSSALQVGYRNGVGSIWRWGGGVQLTYTVPSTGTWFNITATLNGSSNINAYVNGQLDNSTTSANPNSTSLANILISSYSTGGSSERFNGKMSLIHLYNRVLSSTEITQNYNALKGRFGL